MRGMVLRQKVLQAGVSALALLPVSAWAQISEPMTKISIPFGASLGTFEVIQFAMFLGAMGAALLSAGWLIRDRGKIAEENVTLRAKFADLSHAAQRSEALLNLKDQRIVVWDGSDRKPEVVGLLPGTSGAPRDRAGFLAFGRWLRPESVAAFERAVTGLRDQAQSFDLTIETVNGTLLDVQGRTSGSYAIARFVSLEGVQAERALLEAENRRLSEAVSLLRGLLDALDMAGWTRDAQGRLDWVNKAYAKAVGVADPGEAVAGGHELLGTSARERIERERVAKAHFRDRLSTVIGGDRHIFEVTDVAGSAGSAGVAADISEIEQVREELQRTVRSHAETLDQLNTAVAIFDPDMKLQFFNQAFAKLWTLDSAFMEARPSNAMLLDRLRGEGKLPEQPEWRRWKEQVLSAYRAVDPQEHWWHLPDGRTLRVVGNPHPKGGVTWVFENLTEKFDLESRYNTLIRVQGETLDHLAEGVAVFGSDGRIRLSNPSFAALWSLPANLAVEGTHIAAIRAFCEKNSDPALWENFVATVTGFADKREGDAGQLELAGGAILSYALVPLPKGQTMLTFVDVTDTVRVERALKEKNEALELADQIKNDFVQHVSYELRSPLTNIIGFTELLQTLSFGELNERQREYLDHIGTSSSVLLTIVNDILDLATVDAGIMELEIDDVPVAETVSAAAERIADRLREHDIGLKVDLARGIGSFRGDANRIRQVLFNLLSNAANYAPEGSMILLKAARKNAEIVFSVHDDGPGMPKDVLDTVFKRFEPRSNGGRRRGAGLGLSIVKSFVELHGGSVEIDTAAGRGTTVLCRLPVEARIFRVAAE
ncbi:PAS domain-containing sensor histidine kinase [Phyllobacterium leguminum]|uniref:histidine kinase n=1 Tax=Phyllobacterium leguminum TaxID=314237 RepID=A0A318TJ37_9HYPH|nr:PAS domain-containing sensor histidine kinase [Phyllobacterium leguminum]PYE89094.1 PAS domain-containing protein [Phyllobacterium leguminum]